MNFFGTQNASLLKNRLADRNFDFPRVYQQKPLIQGVRVLKGGKPNGGLSECNMHVDRRRIRLDPTAGAHRVRADPRRDD